MLTEQADPAERIASLEARARRVETPCGDGSMVWHVWGEANKGRPPLVLGHGAGGSWLHWVRNVEALSRDRMVIAADLPGQGDSAMPSSETHAGMCAPLAEGIRSIIGQGVAADLVAFSFSSVIFTYLAVLYPDLARRLVVIGCGGIGTEHGETFRKRLAGTSGEERREAIRYNLLGMMLHHAESADDLAIEVQKRDGPRGRLTRIAELIVPDRLIQALPRVSCPVGAIWGEWDRPHPDPAFQEGALRAAKPELDFRVVADAGHWVIYERAETFNRTLIEMLDALPDR
ncbi:MAG TPA: alpha/beta hydrolase [Novosphingobium sp.]|nr:alpha/beta hydrolase [Novosphingobium sp.]